MENRLTLIWYADAQQGKSMSLGNQSSTSDFSTGLAILLLAQLMSAWMGAYVEDTYSMYKASWMENLFYSHAFSLPLFLPISGTLRQQYAKLAATPPLRLHQDTPASRKQQLPGMDLMPAMLLETLRAAMQRLPQGILFLLANAVTQLACISGVNLLSSKSSAVTVTIILNIRKLVSFIFSTLLFGHQLSGKMMVGSALVFGSGALYGYETSWRLPARRRAHGSANGTAEKIENEKKHR